MIDISRQCGLDIKLDNQNYKLIMDGTLMGAETDIRKLEQISSVLYDKDVTELEELYTLYNDVGEPKTRKALAIHGLRYDIGVLPPMKIGCEYIKTIGHYHGLEPKSKMPYAEVYEVVHGAAHFILQKQNAESNDFLEDVLFVKAVAGDRLVMPPDYAHVTINPGPEALLLSNIAAADCSLEYEKIVQKGGMGYFNIEEGAKNIFIKNNNYQDLPEIRNVSLNKLQSFGADDSVPIYSAAKADPEKFNFVTEPKGFAELFGEIIK